MLFFSVFFFFSVSSCHNEKKEKKKEFPLYDAAIVILDYKEYLNA